MESTSTQTSPLEIPELLALILTPLPLPSLLCTLRVSPLWRNTILTTPHLRQTLFLTPIPTTTAYRLGPLREAKAYSITTTTPSPPYTTIPTPSDLNETNLPWATPTLNFLTVLNPLVLRTGTFGDARSLSERLRLGEHVVVTKSRAKLRQLPASPPAVVGEMFLTHPPCSTLSLWLDLDQAKEISNAEGLRVRDLVAAVGARPAVPYWPGVFGRLHNAVCLSEEEKGVVATGEVSEGE